MKGAGGALEKSQGIKNNKLYCAHALAPQGEFMYLLQSSCTLILKKKELTPDCGKATQSWVPCKGPKMHHGDMERRSQKCKCPEFMKQEA